MQRRPLIWRTAGRNEKLKLELPWDALYYGSSGALETPRACSCGGSVFFYKSRLNKIKAGELCCKLGFHSTPSAP